MSESERTDDRVASRLKELRGPRPQPSIAAGVGVSLRAYQQWEAGGGISWSNVQALAAFHGVSPEWLLHGEDSLTSTPSQLDRLQDSLTEVLVAIAREREQREQSFAGLLDLLSAAKEEWRETRLAVQVLDERQRRVEQETDVSLSTTAEPTPQRLDSIEAKLQALLGIALERELESAVERDETSNRDISSTRDESSR